LAGFEGVKFEGRKKVIIGYTTGVFDLFHIGHLNLLKNAKGMCDRLIVGVSTDELVRYKNKKPVISYEERSEIVRSIRYVDAVIPQDDLNKLAAWEKLNFNIMFVGDDWHNTEKWRTYESELSEVGVKIIYLPYTKGVSSSLINEVLIKLRQG
jgi:glycerol-3-phosphate cytidylyltransferase